MAKILFISDLHSEEKCLEFLEALLKREKPEITVFCGDFTEWGPKEFAEKAVEIAQEKSRVLAVGGNLDNAEVLKLLEEKKAFIEEREKTVSGIKFAGLGGCNRNEKRIPPHEREFVEAEIREKLQKLGKMDVLVTHFPPKETIADKVETGEHVGSSELRKFIEEAQPALAVSGHIHEAEGIQKIGKTTIVSVPTLMRARAAVVEFNARKREVASAKIINA